MVEPDVLHAATLTARRLLALFALGALLLFAKRAWFEPLMEPELPTVEVLVAKDAAAIDIERARQRALLAAYAIEHGALETDPVVQRRLREDLGKSDESARALAEAARTLEVERADPMLRERLAWHGEQLLRARVVVSEPGERELQKYLEAHSARYRKPARLTLTHILVADRRGSEQAERLAEVQAAIARGLTLQQASGFSDASLLPRTLEHATPSELDASFGPGFGESVEKLATGAFFGPIASRYGAHFVWLHERTPAHDAELDQVRARVRADFLSDARGAATARAIKELAARYRVALIREGA